MNTLYWHDYETFGADPSWDRPAQFAGLRTDENLEPVGEPLVLYCQPAPDYLPHPEASLITGITPQLALSRGLPEAAFIERVHREFAQPGTCGVGYNSIRFDDEVTRYTLYRNFFDPYAREWRHGNSRWDLIDVLRMCYALRPDGLQWPTNDDGSPSFRLERLTEANGIPHEGAHDALSDVRATLALARKVRDLHPRLYRYAYGLRRKQEVNKLLNLAQPRPLLHISSRYPASRACTAMVLPLCKDPLNGNGVVVCDLLVDPAPLLELDVEEIRRRLFTRADELEEGVARVALKTVHVNRSPMLVTTKVLDEAGFRRLAIDPEVCERHSRRLLQARPDLNLKLQQVFGRELPESDDPDTMLYAGFFDDADRRLMDQVLASSPAQLAQTQLPFRDPRLEPLLFRYRARNFPDSLSTEECSAWESWRQSRLRDPALAKGRSLMQYFSIIDEKMADAGLGDRERAVLLALREYGVGLADSVATK